MGMAGDRGAEAALRQRDLISALVKGGNVMKLTLSAVAAALIVAGCSPHEAGKVPDATANAAVNTTGTQRPSEAESEAYMRQAERDWAALAVAPIPGLLDRILADDYVAVSSKGDVRSKAEQIRLDAPDPAFASSKLDYVHYRHFGDTVLAQGQESLQRKDGGPDLSLIWTDVWMFRDGKWQIVASQDSVLPQTK
jgi:uncharacterized protein DUF4440